MEIAKRITQIFDFYLISSSRQSKTCNPDKYLAKIKLAKMISNKILLLIWTFFIGYFNSFLLFAGMNLTFGPNWIILKCTEKNASLKLAWSSRPRSRTHFARTPARYVDSVCERVTPTDPLVYTSVRRLFLQHQRKWQQAKQQLCWQSHLRRLFQH